MKIVNIGNRVLNNYLVETDRGWVANGGKQGSFAIETKGVSEGKYDV